MMRRLILIGMKFIASMALAFMVFELIWLSQLAGHSRKRMSQGQDTVTIATSHRQMTPGFDQRLNTEHATAKLVMETSTKNALTFRNIEPRSSTVTSKEFISVKNSVANYTKENNGTKRSDGVETDKTTDDGAKANADTEANSTIKANDNSKANDYTKSIYVTKTNTTEISIAAKANDTKAIYVTKANTTEISIAAKANDTKAIYVTKANTTEISIAAKANDTKAIYVTKANTTEISIAAKANDTKENYASKGDDDIKANDTPKANDTKANATKAKFNDDTNASNNTKPRTANQANLDNEADRNAKKEFLEKVVQLSSSQLCVRRFRFALEFPGNSSSERMMSVSGPGRLGNKMFQYASLLGISRRNGYKPLLGNDVFLMSVFNMLGVSRQQVPTATVFYTSPRAAKYDPCVERFPNVSSLVHLFGYYQSWKFFNHVEQEVRELFQFNENIKRQVWAFFNSSALANKTPIGVHVRKCDMATEKSKEKGYTTATAEYFSLAMTYFRQKFSDVIFIVCSDAIDWAKQNIVGYDVVYYHTNLAADLAVLAHCKHSIMSTGSYSWWAAWLAGGETVYYSNFPANNSTLSLEYDKKDYFMPHWLGMEA